MLTLYKIRNKDTGLYSTGGASPSWSKTGKTWSKVCHITAHLNHVEKRGFGSRYKTYLADAEIVLFEATPTWKKDLVVFVLQLQEQRRMKKQKKEEAYRLARIKGESERLALQEKRERKQLQKLQAKYPDNKGL